MQMLKSSSTCFKYFPIINFARKTIALVVVDLLAGFCINIRKNLIKAKAMSVLTFFFLNNFLILKLTSKAATGVVCKKQSVMHRNTCWSLFLIKLQAFRDVARLIFYTNT